MDAAVIAVVGTISGVIVTAIAGILTAIISGRNQRALSEMQAERETRKAEAAARRADFTAFLKAYDDVYAGGEALFSQAATLQGLDPRKELFDQIRSFKQAHLILSITSAPAVWHASNLCLRSMWGFLDAAVTGDQELYEAAVERATDPREQVRAAMREQLNAVED
jgi:hypothetical protein